ncbi:hypothetical protein [Streptomyces sp. NBC_01236]|uniref:hypothetical protein n=1 Tax=Streptomyces sp. NBC_01236 TaxID=2903789 RepID=UPI002E1149AB|nr:hypothetical protein OG324_51250 [Streptomyces sp. NBC_01236]
MKTASVYPTIAKTDAVHDRRMFHHVPMLAAGARLANATPAERGRTAAPSAAGC